MSERIFYQEKDYVWCNQPCNGPFEDGLDCCMGPVEGKVSTHISAQFPKCTAIGSPKSNVSIPLTFLTEQNYYLREKHGKICRYHCEELNICEPEEKEVY